MNKEKTAKPKAKTKKAAATKANDAATEAGQAVAVAEPYLQGLWYPIIIGAICFIIGAIYVDGKSTSHKH